MNADIIDASFLFRVHTAERGARVTPTVDFGLSFGHIIGVWYETESQLLEPNPLLFDGFPAGGSIPDRRFYHGTIDLGLGLACSLGEPDMSTAIVPALSMHIPLTSLTKNPGEEITPFSLEALVEVRVPISFSSE